MDIGKAIKTFRRQKGMKQSDLARQAGISTSFASLIEQNKRDPNFSVVVRIAKALDVPLIMLLFLAGDREEIAKFDRGLAEKMSVLAFRMMNNEEDM